LANTLIAIDGNSLIHRAFHALPPLTSPKGDLTNASFGFTNMLIRVMGDLHPTHAAAAFDTPRPTFRHQRYDAYKGTRPPTPDGLSSQFAQVFEVLNALHIPIFRVDGLEADDLLGTMATLAPDLGLDVIIITGDTDALQLVSPHVRVLVPRKGMSDTVLYDEQGVRERYGLEPAQLVDLRALRGDVSDNIPGIPGIGEKTATKLLQSYGDVAGIIASLGDMPAKTRGQIEPYVEQMHMTRDLAEIVRTAPIELDLEATTLRPPDREVILPLFHELGFRSLIDRLDTVFPGREVPTPIGRAPSARARAGNGLQPTLIAVSSNGSSADAADAEARGVDDVVHSLDDLRSLVERLHGTDECLSFMLLLDHAEAMRAEILGIAVAAPSIASAYVPFTGEPVGDGPGQAASLPLAEALDILKPVLEDAAITKASINAKQAMIALARRGITLRGVDFDSGLAAYLVEASQRTLSLSDLSWSRLNRELPGIKSVLGEGRSAITPQAAPIERMAGFLCQEAEALLDLQPILTRELTDSGLDELYREVELPLVDVLAAMETAGIAVDVPYLAEFSKELYARIVEVEKGIFDSVGHDFNINSSQQLATVLFDELQLPGAKRTSTGRASTAADVLSGLKGAHPAVELVLEHRELTKLKSTYVDALPLLVNDETHRIHTTFNQTVAATGRLSSADPNVQNIPVRTELGRRVRRAFVAPAPGWKLLSADYSQIELRVQAHLTQDPTLLEAFKSGEDVHAATAAEMFGVEIDAVTSDQRRLAKTANFAIIYGISAFGFAEQTGLSQAQAGDFIRRYFEKFNGVSAFQKRLIADARETGTVTTLLGRKRTIPELRSHVHTVRAAGERMAINAPVQGTASDIIKIAMVRLRDAMVDRGMRARMLLQVHDELLFETPDEELDDLKELAKTIMEGAMTLSVPLVVDLRAADSWGGMY
jgi:DNA polymerase-1